MHQRVDDTWSLWSASYVFYDKEGEGHERFHPTGLPPRRQLLPIAEMGSGSEFLQHAQRRWSQIIHHSAWLQLATRMQGVSTRELVRLVSVSQPGSGAFLDMPVDGSSATRFNTAELRVSIQRRTGLLLSEAAAACDALEAAQRSAKDETDAALEQRARK